MTSSSLPGNDDDVIVRTTKEHTMGKVLAMIFFVYMMELGIVPTVGSMSVNARWSVLSAVGTLVLFLVACANLHRIDCLSITYEYAFLREAVACLVSVFIDRKYNKTTTYLATFCVLETYPRVKLRETRWAVADKPRDAFVQMQLLWCSTTHCYFLCSSVY